MAEATETMFFTIAEGAVDPAVRIASGLIQEEDIDKLEGRIRDGEYTVRDLDPAAIPCDCMDCRGTANGQMPKGARAAAGSFTMVVADALTTDSYRHPGEKAPAHKARVYTELRKNGQKVGGHVATSVPYPEYAGCGAEDKLDDTAGVDRPSILNFMQRKAVPIFNTIRGLGADVSDELESDITSKAATLQAEGYAASGKEISQAGIEVAGEDSVVELAGPQNGVLVAILTTPGSRLDQDRIREDFGSDYEVFEVHAWSIANGAKATSTSEAEAHDKEVAGLAYNLGAGGVIAGPGMRIVVL